MNDLGGLWAIAAIVALLIFLNKINGYGWPWQWAAAYGGRQRDMLLAAAVFFGFGAVATLFAFGLPK